MRALRALAPGAVVIRAVGGGHWFSAGLPSPAFTNGLPIGRFFRAGSRTGEADS